MFLPVNAGFASGLPGYDAAAPPGQAQAGLILYGAIGSFAVWGGAGEVRSGPGPPPSTRKSMTPILPCGFSACATFASRVTRSSIS